MSARAVTATLALTAALTYVGYATIDALVTAAISRPHDRLYKSCSTA